MPLFHLILHLFFSAYPKLRERRNSDSFAFYDTSIPDSDVPPSYRHSAIICPYTSNIETRYLVYGGTDSNGNLLSSLFFLRIAPDKIHWTSLPTISLEKGPRREGSAYFVYDNSFYVWGGKGSDGLFNDLHVYSPSASTWTVLSQTGAIPPACSRAAFCTDDQYFYLYGGSRKDQLSSDLFRMDLATRRWEKFNIPVDDTLVDAGDRTSPGAFVDGHLFCFDHRLFLFGGLMERDELDDSTTIWMLDLSTVSDMTAEYHWTPLTAESSATTSSDTHFNRYQSGMSILPGTKKVVFYSGYFINDLGVQQCNSVLIVDLTKYLADSTTAITFEEYPFDTAILETNSKLFPTKPAFCTQLVNDNGNQYIVGYTFGGVSTGVVNGDLASYYIPHSDYAASKPADVQGDKVEFLHVDCSAIPNLPSPRAFHGAVCVHGYMWVFGGKGSSEDTSRSSAGSGDVTYFNDLYSLDLSNLTHWEFITPSSSLAPSPRAHFAMFEFNGRLWIFGGMGYSAATGLIEPQNDLWSFSVETKEWTENVPSTAVRPPPLYNVGFLAYSQCLFIYGGLDKNDIISNEMWKFSFVTNTWMRCDIQPASSTPRNGATLGGVPIVIDGVSRIALLALGGTNYENVNIRTPDVFLLPVDQDLHYDASYTLQSFPDIDLSAFLTKYAPIPQGACITVTQSGILSVGGLDYNHRVNIVTSLDFAQLLAPKTYFHEISQPEKDLNGNDGFYSYGASLVALGRQLYIFGGVNMYGLSTPTNTQFINSLHVLHLDSSRFTCTPGTFLNPDDEDNYGCTWCPPGTIARSYGAKQCTPCYAGSVTAYSASSSGYHCRPCPSGTYAPQAGTAQCLPCPEGRYCPAGSKTENNSIPSADTSYNHQPEQYDDISDYAIIFTIMCYAVGIFVGILFAIIALLCPCTRIWLNKLDCFTDEHDDEIDPITLEGPKTVRQTALGGFVCVIYIFFAVSVFFNLLVTYIRINMSETKSLIYEIMFNEDYSTDFETEHFELSFKLIDFRGPCVADDEASSVFTRCHSAMKVISSSVSPESSLHSSLTCRVAPASNKYVDSLSVCDISLKLSPATFYFTRRSAPATITLTFTDPDPYAYAIQVSAETDSGIFGLSPAAKRRSSRAQLFRDSNGYVQRGPIATTFNFYVSQSHYTGITETGKGLQIVDWTIENGSIVDGTDLRSHFGLHVNVNFILDQNAILTDWSRKQEPPSFLIDAIASFTSFLGIFGSLVGFLEFIEGKDCPGWNLIRDCFCSLLYDSDIMAREQNRREIEMREPENSSISTPPSSSPGNPPYLNPGNQV